MRFETKRDGLFKYTLLYVGRIFLVVSIILFTVILIGDNKLGLLLFPVMLFLFFIITNYVWYQFNYKIENYKLYISIGNFVVYNLSLGKVKLIRKGCKGTYIYGLASDTITLNIQGDEIRVSPIDTERFIKELLKYNPNIELEGSLKKFL